MLKNLIKKQGIHPEQQYLNLINELLEEENIEIGRMVILIVILEAQCIFHLKITQSLY